MLLPMALGHLPSLTLRRQRRMPRLGGAPLMTVLQQDLLVVAGPAERREVGDGQRIMSTAAAVQLTAEAVARRLVLMPRFRLVLHLPLLIAALAVPGGLVGLMVGGGGGGVMVDTGLMVMIGVR